VDYRTGSTGSARRVVYCERAGGGMSCLVLTGLALACEAKPDCAGLDKATCESTDRCVSNPVTQYQNGVDQRIDYRDRRV